MFLLKTAPVFPLLLGLLVLLVAETYSFQRELETVPATLNDFWDKGSPAILSSPQRSKTFKKYDISLTHKEAKDACEKMGGQLALPMNIEEEDQMRKEIGYAVHKGGWTRKNYWIGGTGKAEQGTWIENETGRGLSYENFIAGEPDNRYGKERCLNASPEQPGWYDVVCNDKKTGYVCEFINE